MHDAQSPGICPVAMHDESKQRLHFSISLVLTCVSFHKLSLNLLHMPQDCGNPIPLFVTPYITFCTFTPTPLALLMQQQVDSLPFHKFLVMP